MIMTISRPQLTQEITQGVLRLCLDLGYAPILEFTLKTGRRADVCGVSAKGEIIIIEVKSSYEDYRCDNKWHEYDEYCDEFYFAVGLDFPKEIIPENVGLIISDGFGGQIVRPAIKTPLSAPRRKAVTLMFARAAAFKWMQV